MINSLDNRSLLIVGVVALAVGIVFTGSAMANASTLDEMDGDGTEDHPYVITDIDELQAIEDDPDAHYVLGNDIDAGETETWNGGAGFEPIGDRGSPFTGSFDGQKHTIESLNIDRSGDRRVGLFGVSEGIIENVHLENIDVRGGDGTVGTLVGEHDGEVRGTSATGTVRGDLTVGGLIGGSSYGPDSLVERSSANVDVNGQSRLGGLVGSTTDMTISESYATGTVEGERLVGGLVGWSVPSAEVRLSYATGDVIADREAGGLIGRNEGTASGILATGEVTADSDAGGLAGENDGMSDAYWDIESSGKTVGDVDENEAVGLRTSGMTGTAAGSNMNGLDFDNFWTLTDEYPILEWQVEDVSISLDESTVGAGEETSATVTLTLDDGSTVIASEVADYDAGGIASVDADTVDAEQQGTAEITATVAGESDSVELEITEPPQIELEDTEFDADAVVEGSSLTATATYENNGGPGSHTAELIADGDVVDSQTVSLDADDETTIDFEWEPDSAVGNEYEIAIDDMDLGSIEIVGPGTITLEDATVPDRVGSGAPYEFTVDLDNEADETVIDTVAYERDDEFVFTEPVAVDPDGTTEILGDETDADVGLTIAHEVTVHDETLTGTSDVTDPPTFEISDIDAPNEVKANEEFELTATIDNTGGVEGTQTVSVSDDESAIEAEELTIESEASEEVSIAVTESETGDYEYTVATDDEEVTASVTVAETESEGDDSDGLPGFGVAAAIVALSLVALIRRRRV